MIGKTLGHYEITAALGAGGMGEVYRARDTKLGREVALKILPTAMSGDPERLARFEREARTLATLQHPHIASIYGFEQQQGTRFLVMELAEGEDLSERIARGPLPVDEAVGLAVQLAEGLEAAHAVGIIHRDLKPANIKISSEDGVKILDFGLARAYTGDESDDSDLENSPTITAAMTQAGTILGTAAYMSPEQARGRPVDQRTDIWSLGVILTEMLTGKRVFEGETVSDTLAAVLRADLSETQLPSDLPPNVLRVLRRCLERDRRKRMRSAGDVWLELNEAEASADSPAGAATRFRSLLPAALALLALSIVLAGWFLRPQSDPELQRPTHLALALPDGYQFASRAHLPWGSPQPCLDISRDGRVIVSAIENEDEIVLYRHILDDRDGNIIPGTEGAYHPRISPDGTRIAFFSDNTLKRVDVHGDRVTSIADFTYPSGQCWYDDDQLLLVDRLGSEMVLVDVQGGAITPVLESATRSSWPEKIPGMEAVLLNDSFIVKNDETESDPIVMYWLDGSKQEALEIKGTMPRFLGDESILFIQEGAMMAAQFSSTNPSRQHRAQTVLEGVLVESGFAHFAVSGEGTLVYVAGDWLVGKSLVWADSRGTVDVLDFPSLGYGAFKLSPDGSRVAVTIGTANSSIWVYDLDRGTRRVLANEGVNTSPTWSPDGSRLAYASREGEQQTVKIQTIGGNSPPEVVLSSEGGGFVPDAWHEEAGLLLTRVMESHDIVRIDPAQPEEIEVIVASPATEWGADISPNGRWIVYSSGESGRSEVYARALAPESPSWPVSVDGGESPLWNSDGTAIFFRNGNEFLRAEIREASDDGARFRAAVPEVHVTGSYSNVPGTSYDLSPDDEHLLLLKTQGAEERPSHLNMILNFDLLVSERIH